MEGRGYTYLTILVIVLLRNPQLIAPRFFRKKKALHHVAWRVSDLRSAMKRGLRSQTSRGSIMFFLFLLRGKVLAFIGALSLPCLSFRPQATHHQLATFSKLSSPPRFSPFGLLKRGCGCSFYRRLPKGKERSQTAQQSGGLRSKAADAGKRKAIKQSCFRSGGSWKLLWPAAKASGGGGAS